VGVSGEASLAPEMVTLAEILTGAGYHAAAVVGGPSLARRLDLGQGFSTYDVTASDDRPEGHTAAAVAEARALLVETGEPWFLWLHPGDPHGAAGPPSGEPGRWLDELAAAGRLERTLLIVTAIPRESPEETAVPSAGRDSLALDRVRVPLLLAGPGVSAGAVIEPPVSTAAVFATVLDAAGLAPPPALPRPPPVPSLLPLAARRRSNAPPAFVESATEIGVARGDAYLRRERAGGDARRPRFRELIPLAGSRVPIAVERDLDAVLDAFERRAAAAASRPATP